MLIHTKGRLMTWITALLIAGILAGCGAKETPAPAPEPAKVSAPAPAPAPVVDKAAVVKAAGVSFFDAVPPTLHLIEAPQLQPKIDAKDPSLFVLDIRKPEDFATGYIPGSVNVPFAAVGKNLDKLPSDKQIVVVCYSGQTAGQVVGLLRTLGYNAIHLKGGFPAWAKEKYQVATDPAAPPAPAASQMAFTGDKEIVRDAVMAYLDSLPANSNMIDNKDLQAKLEAKDTSIFLVDVRPTSVFAEGHIEGATNIVMATLGQNLDKLPKDKQIVVNCNGGFTSGQTVAVLKMMGYNAISVKGGFQGWLKAELPHVK